MKITKNWKDIVPNPGSKELDSFSIELTPDELKLVINGLKYLHSDMASNGNWLAIEECRAVSDLYYGLKY